MSPSQRLRAVRRGWVGSTAWLLAVTLAGAVVWVATALVPEGTPSLFPLVVVAGSLAVSSLVVIASQGRALASFRVLASGRETPSAKRLGEAAREVLDYPEHLLWSLVQVQGVALAAAGLMLAALPEIGFGGALRFCALAALVLPLPGTVARALVRGRVQEAVDALGDLGLPSQTLLALPVHRQTPLRNELTTWVAFSGAALLFGVVDQALAGRGPTHFGTLAALGALAGAGAFVVMRSVLVPLRALTARAQRLAQGQLGGTGVVVVAHAEVWEASRSLELLRLRLGRTLGQVQSTAAGIGAAAEQLVATTSRQEVGSASQSTALTQTSATTEELARSARQIAGNASDVAATADQTREAAEQGKRAADGFLASMARMRGYNQAIADAVVRLNKRVQQIGRIVEFINGIGDKSDLLALNAELEGNKAGGVGLGFSLVAAEMRRLAESVVGSTKEIARLIDEIRDSTNSAVMATEAGGKATDAGEGHSREVSQTLGGVLEQARRTSDAVRAISAATQQQQTGTDQLADAMAEVLHSTVAAAQASRELAKSSGRLADLAKDLDTEATFYRVS